MSATLSDYAVLIDAGFKLSFFQTQEAHVDFNPPDNIILNSSTSRPVLCFRADPDGAADLKLKVEVQKLGTGDEATVLSLPMKSSEPRTVHEVLGGSQLHTGTNRFVFKVDEESGGSVSVTDVVLLYRRPVNG
ncbi:hypothetical protein [Ruegeria jejuensis]|uniref:hypothetical protein n=1 Tax=Ruegeria jejuensis TaxID=3233338 RepID=UPI00355C0544